MLRRILCLVMILGLFLSGCKDEIRTQHIEGSNCANITMGDGEFAYYNGMIYFTDYFNIFEYDTESNKLVGYNSKHSRIKSLFASEDNVYFSDSGLHYITKDGKTVNEVFEREGICAKLFVEEDTVYLLDGIGGDLISHNIKDGSETVISKFVSTYYVDDENIYLINETPKGTKLTRYERETAITVDVELSFSPVSVISHEDDVYLSTSETYQIIRITNNIETALPINAYYFQIVDNKLFFLDENTFENSCYTLKMYDMTTNETVILFENVFNFCVLESRFVCAHIGTTNERYTFYDLENRNSTVMYDKIMS